MKLRALGFFYVLLLLLGAVGGGCYPYHRVGVDVTVHDARWHYNHDYDDNYRVHHPWHEDRRDWDHLRAAFRVNGSLSVYCFCGLFTRSGPAPTTYPI